MLVDELSKKSFQPVRVDDDCWLGVNCVVAPGITVGKGCIVGANSVVTRDLPPYVVAAGAPARIVKNRLDFRPPRTIDYSVETDLPYFYSGIGVSRAERTVTEPRGGLRGDCEFSISMNAAGARSVCLLARSNTDEPCTVRHLNHERELNQDYRKIEFPIVDSDTSRFFFEVPHQKNRWPILIQKAWVE
jgi:hypothetical protein